MKNRSKNYLLFLATICLIVLIDRLLLLYFGLPLWKWDETLHFKHRPNIIRYWTGYDNKPIQINEYGQHDDSFPIKKDTKELRILNLGDSITMGHGVSKDETYSRYLETFLLDSLKNYNKVQAINTGVQGYSPFQELELLKRSLIFQPDIVTIGFCLNDVTEPFTVNKNLGGTGLDYHKVTQAPNKYLSFLLNETGFGRLIQEIRIRKLDAKQEKLNEIWDVKKMLRNKNDLNYQKQWEFTFNELSKIYNLCKSRQLRVILLIFPYTFQFKDKNLSWAQLVLIEHAKLNDIPFIDFLKIFENKIDTDSIKLKEYFLDEDHFTPLGHQVVAKELCNRIINMLQ